MKIKTKGFTVIEGIVVVAILLIIGSTICLAVAVAHYKNKPQTIEQSNEKPTIKPVNVIYDASISGNEIRVFTISISNKTYLVSSGGGVVEIRKEE